LLSVFDQTYQDYEVILVNDASSDDSIKILSRYAERPNVILLENKYNEGVAYSRNRAILAASGEYIAIHDADDSSLSYRFEKQVKILDNRKEIAVTGGHAIRIGTSGQFLGCMSYPPPDTPKALYVIRQHKLNPIIDPSSMFRRQAFLDIGGYSMDSLLRTVQDFDLWCRLLVTGHQLYNFQEPLIKYRINPSGVTRLKEKEQKVATDEVWASFMQKSFPIIKLRESAFLQDSHEDLSNIHNKEK